jgi:hypothetical protein
MVFGRLEPIRQITFGAGHEGAVIVEKVKTKKSEVDADASTKDLPMVTSKVALSYHINPTGTAQFFQKFGNNFEPNVLVPSLQEILKAVTARSFRQGKPIRNCSPKSRSGYSGTNGRHNQVTGQSFH